LQGFKQQEHFENAKELLLSFTYQNMVGNKIAVKSAENYRQLRSNGITIQKTIDVIIATFCIENKHQLLHSDRDFAAIEINLSLQVYHPKIN